MNEKEQRSGTRIAVQTSAASGGLPVCYLSRPALVEEDYQMGELELPSRRALEEIGRVVVRFGQLEHLLKLIYKRSGKNILLRSVLNLKVTLGGLLSGARAKGESFEFEGLINLAKKNPRLIPVLDQLKQAQGLCAIRNKYVHNGIGRNANKKFFFLNSGEELDDAKIIKDLDQVSESIEVLLSEINEKVPGTHA